MTNTPYLPSLPDDDALRSRADELRARIPGWGADLDPADRPSGRQVSFEPTGAHWDFPPRQPEMEFREKSVEHSMLTPVFGTSAPLRGLAGALRRYSYKHFSEGRAAHWLILLGADRVDAIENQVHSFVTARPDNPITQTGVLSELKPGIFASRFGKDRADTRHTWIDPIIVAGPWVVAGWAAYRVIRRIIR
ncbi:hypothetical protein [Glaciihabitans sp. dw_435]|uniref:hypothetical protein n=1 Tax=Glaciihabitans sp. dw_435 TaxID=2720081 RepID=UPI001BD24285|nr:hypothetical protein [Glaciihabitans sp. dw_435]